MSNFKPYPHQRQALQATWSSMSREGYNPVCCVPTGGGKTIIAGYLAKAFLMKNPEARVAVLAHVGELVKQNATTIQDILKKDEHFREVPVGIYSASVGNRKDFEHQVICANIQSIYSKTNLGK